MWCSIRSSMTTGLLSLFVILGQFWAPWCSRQIRGRRIYNRCKRFCANLVDFHHLSKTYSQQNLLSVKYEDLIENSQSVAARIGNFVGVREQRSKIQSFIRTHSALDLKTSGKLLTNFLPGEKIPPNRSKRMTNVRAKMTDRNRAFVQARRTNKKLLKGLWLFYNTERSPDFDHEHWRAEIPIETLSKIQTNPVCVQAMKLFNYKMLRIN